MNNINICWPWRTCFSYDFIWFVYTAWLLGQQGQQQQQQQQQEQQCIQEFWQLWELLKLWQLEFSHGFIWFSFIVDSSARAIWINEWSDDMDPMDSIKSNRNSVWIKTVTVAPPHGKRENIHSRFSCFVLLRFVFFYHFVLPISCFTQGFFPGKTRDGNFNYRIASRGNQSKTGFPQFPLFYHLPRVGMYFHSRMYDKLIRK